VVVRIRGSVVNAAGYRTDSCALEVMGVDTLNRGQRRYIATSTSPSPGTDASIIRIAPIQPVGYMRLLDGNLCFKRTGCDIMLHCCASVSFSEFELRCADR
jgi:hypothetical protein